MLRRIRNFLFRTCDFLNRIKPEDFRIRMNVLDHDPNFQNRTKSNAKATIQMFVVLNATAALVHAFITRKWLHMEQVLLLPPSRNYHNIYSQIVTDYEPLLLSLNRLKCSIELYCSHTFTFDFIKMFLEFFTCVCNQMVQQSRISTSDFLRLLQRSCLIWFSDFVLFNFIDKTNMYAFQHILFHNIFFFCYLNILFCYQLVTKS